MNENQFTTLRERMVSEQLEGREITDRRVLDAMRRVPRHLFLPPDQAPDAYSDSPLPIACGQTISQPAMVAIVLQTASLTGTKNVLEVGAGSGYQAALLAELSCRVTSIERVPDLAMGAERVLRSLGYTSVQIVVGDGTLGYPANAPYDRIIVAAGSPRVPAPLLEQLAPNGKLVIPVGDAVEQHLLVISKGANGAITRRDEGMCAFVPLIGVKGWPQ